MCCVLSDNLVFSLKGNTRHRFNYIFYGVFANSKNVGLEKHINNLKDRSTQQ